jgi:hypothetical protein
MSGGNSENSTIWSPASRYLQANNCRFNMSRRGNCWDNAVVEIRIVLAGLRGEESVLVLCRRHGVGDGLYYSWS